MAHPMPKQLENKVCFIAGASGAIGSAVAALFHREGALLALGSRSGRCDAVVDSPRAGKPPLHVRFDASRWDEVRKAVAQVHRRFGAIDVLVNCSGVQGPIGPAHTLDPAEWARTIDTNLVGAFHLVRAVAPLMIGRGGSIIHFSGGGAAYARPFFSAYAASKAALVRLTECLADELRGSDIRVNAVAPGPVRSRMWDEMRNAGASAGAKTLREIEQMDETGGVPAARAAALALFLASPRSAGLTGRLISGVHDRWEEFPEKIPAIMKTEGGTLRRIPLD